MEKKLIAVMTAAALAAMFGATTVSAAGAGYGGSAGSASSDMGMGAAGQTAGADFSSLDMNNDGYISQDEAQGHQQLSNNWQTADTNADNQIDQAEFSAFEQQGGGMTDSPQVSPDVAPDTPADTGAGVEMTPDSAAGGMGTDQTAAVGFDTLDANQDGYVSQDEAAGDQRLLNNWQSADADADGRVSESEFSAFEAQQPGDTGMDTQPGVGTDPEMGTPNGTGGGMDSGTSGGGM